MYFRENYRLVIHDGTHVCHTHCHVVLLLGSVILEYIGPLKLSVRLMESSHLHSLSPSLPFPPSVVGWFLANQYLSLAIAFPIVTAVS